MRQIDPRSLGAHGEKSAADYLRKHHYKILCKNYKKKSGEVDIIASDKEYIVFVEVKTRRRDPMLSGMYAVNADKRRHIRNTASLYLLDHPSSLQPRFDVIEIEMDESSGKVVSVNHIINAF